MRNFFTIAILALSINAFSQSQKTIIVKFTDGACNEAACKCNDCYWKFIEANGTELLINEIDKKIKMELLLSKENEAEGYVEVIPNPSYLNKKFEISYITTKCECQGVEPNKKYKKLTSIKMIK